MEKMDWEDGNPDLLEKGSLRMRGIGGAGA
jgi:hypothetical protein